MNVGSIVVKREEVSVTCPCNKGGVTPVQAIGAHSIPDSHVVKIEHPVETLGVKTLSLKGRPYACIHSWSHRACPW